MSHADLLAMLLPPVSYELTAPALAGELAAEGMALDAAQHSANRVRAAVTPYFAGLLLREWERVCDITAPAGAGYQQRLHAVLAKLAETGGLSIPYFSRLAEGMGCRISICEPQPLRAGTSRAGDIVWVPDIVWVWQVIVHGPVSQAFRFRVGQSAAGERLTVFGDVLVETLFKDLKPAHTFVYFAYQEA